MSAASRPHRSNHAIAPQRTDICDAAAVEVDGLSRDVYGLLGLPIDAIDFTSLLQSLDMAVGSRAPCLISTANVNFLIISRNNVTFRNSLVKSHLCIADGMPLIWIAKMLGVPIHERLAGSDLFVRLRSGARAERKLKVFLLGGADGLAEIVSNKLNAEGGPLECVGVLNPGFGTIEEMSSEPVIEAINSAGADLLAVFFSAQKAQSWLIHNAHRIQIPVRAQFGATINFEAGTIRRAPHLIRSTGFEWLWRIKEEPYLWRRYWSDGIALLGLMLTSVLPLMLEARLRRSKSSGLSMPLHEDVATCTVSVEGDAVARNIDAAIQRFRYCLGTGKQIAVDLSKAGMIDARFFGLLLMVRNGLSGGRQLSFIGSSARTRRLFRLNGFEFLLAQDFETKPLQGLSCVS